MSLRGVTTALCLVLASVALGGCGFRPLYGTASGEAQAPATELAFVDVSLMPNREGQVLRQELQRRLERGGQAEAKKYVLAVNYSVALEGLGVLRDTTLTRYRVHGQANWSLRPNQPGAPVLIGGVARAMDGVNSINQQYFAVDQAADAARGRVSREVAEQIVTRIASYFASRGASGTGS